MNDLPPDLRQIEDRLRHRFHPPLPPKLRQRILVDRTESSSWFGEIVLMAAGLILAINAIAVVASRSRDAETDLPSLADLDRQTAAIQGALPDLDPASARHTAVFAILGTHPVRFGPSVSTINPHFLTLRLENLP